MEETQMEMFNFLWLIWDHYLLTPNSHYFENFEKLFWKKILYDKLKN